MDMNTLLELLDEDTKVNLSEDSNAEILRERLSKPNIGAKIKNRRKSLGLSVEELAKRINKNRATIYRYESSEIENLPITILEPLAKALETTPAKLMGWEDKEEAKTLCENKLSKPNQENIWKITPVRKIPIISEIACGNPIVLNEEEKDYIEVEDYIKGDFAFKARGDSMINAGIDEGDIVFISKNKPVNNGDIVAVSIESEITLKTYRQNKDKIYFLPENSNYDPIIFDIKETEYTHIEIIGIATHILKPLKNKN